MFSSADFRKELLKVMPGYKWTVHKTGNAAEYLYATGIQSSGFNRLSTLRVTRRTDQKGAVIYEVKSAPYGTKSPWAHEVRDGTLARALRQLQDYYRAKSQNFNALASSLELGRKSPDEGVRL